MDLAPILRELWQRRAWVALAACVATLLAVMTSFHVSLAPPSAEKRKSEVGAASTQVLVDSPRSPVADLRRDFAAAEDRAAVYGPLLSSMPVRALVARRADLPVEAIVTGGAATDEGGQPAEKRANQIIEEDGLHRLRATVASEAPILTIFTQGPSAEAAVKLADAAAAGLADYIVGLQAAQNVPRARRAKVRQLGDATGGVISSGTSAMIAALTFVAVLAGGCLAILFFSGLRDSWRRLDDEQAAFAALGPDDETDELAAAARSQSASPKPRAVRVRQKVG